VNIGRQVPTFFKTAYIMTKEAGSFSQTLLLIYQKERHHNVQKCNLQALLNCANSEGVFPISDLFFIKIVNYPIKKIRMLSVG
jgi:hypothetical protein